MRDLGSRYPVHIDVDECSSQFENPCGVGGDCMNEDGSFLCLCHEDYYDRRCEIKGKGKNMLLGVIVRRNC